MPLKYFHLLLITLATLLTLGFAVWCFKSHFSPEAMPTLGAGILSLIIGLCLPVYAVIFFKKVKSL